MSAKRTTIGRTFQTPNITSSDVDQLPDQILTLSTGRKVAFNLKVINASDIEKKTYVVPETNGRDQASLTADSLKDITRTLMLHQFFPCIGVERENAIEILDGSRRRAAAIICGTPLKILVTSSDVSTVEARNLAQDIQTAKEHNLREIGLRLQALKISGLNQKEIAAQEKLSPAKVSRAMQAASVPQELVSLFPVQSELNFTDYKMLANADDVLAASGINLKTLLENISDEVGSIQKDIDLAEDEIKDKILKLILKESSLLTSQPKKGKSLILPLWTFDDKDRFARKKIRGRMISFEFNRLSKDLLDEVEKTINELLEKHLL